MQYATSTRFVTTQWGLVQQAGTANEAVSADALGQLYSVYREPLVGYVTRSGFSRESAEDLVEDFFNRLIQRGSFATLAESKGRFRTFLMVAIDRFLVDHRRKLSAIKRGGLGTHVPLEEATPAELGDATHGDVAHAVLEYDHDWAVTLLRRSLARLKEEYGRSRQEHAFCALLPWIDKPILGADYDCLAASLESTPGATKAALCRLRSRFNSTIRAMVKDTVADPAETENEIRHLVNVLALHSGIVGLQSDRL